jgi:hypothetical protein
MRRVIIAIVVIVVLVITIYLPVVFFAIILE